MRTNPLSPDRLDGLGIFALMAKALMFLPPEARTLYPPATQARAAPSVAPPLRRGWLDRLDHWLWTQQQRDVEAYLAKATDLYDLEVRIRTLERNPSSRSFH